MTHDQILEKARNKFPTAKSIRVLETTRWPFRNQGTTRAELWVTGQTYHPLTLFADDLDNLAIEIERYEPDHA